jgi:hypothetical protein
MIGIKSERNIEEQILIIEPWFNNRIKFNLLLTQKLVICLLNVVINIAMVMQLSVEMRNRFVPVRN